MPTDRRYRRRRRIFRKRRMMGGIATRPRRSRPMTVGKVKRIISAELKFLSKDLTDQPFNVAPTGAFILPLSDVPQGDSNQERDGNRITPVNVHGHITLFGDPAGAGDAFTNVKITILRWLEDASSTPPTAALLMQDVANLGGSYNIDNKGMFKVLYSRYFVLVNNEDNPSVRKTFRYYIKLSGKTLFDGAANTDLKKFQIYLILQSNSNTATASLADVNNTFRFTDS